MNGKVYLVGAGPGDPELLTVKALRLLQTAQVVLHDDLVAPEILKLIPSTAQVQNVGKRCGTKTMRQEEINFLLVALADSGRQVVRLKSGDPLIFGRAGEEIEALRRCNIAYEIVPGVTSALGAAAAAGIPLTHRQISSTLVLTAGHRAAEKFRCGVEQVQRKPNQLFSSTCRVTIMLRWPTASQPPDLRKKLLAQLFRGRPLPDSKIHHTTISNLHRSPELEAPTLLVVGEVVKFADHAAGQPETSFPGMESAFAAARVQIAISSERLRQEERLA